MICFVRSGSQSPSISGGRISYFPSFRPLRILITVRFRRTNFLFSFVSSAPDPHRRAFPADEFLIFLHFVRSGSSSPCVLMI